MKKPSRVVCIGGATLDRKLRAVAALVPGTSNPVASSQAFGGVARNVAENLARLEVPVGLSTLVGDDERGRALCEHLEGLGVDLAHVEIAPGRATAEYLAVLEPAGDLAFGLADMAILDAITVAHLQKAKPGLDRADWVFADCNLPEAVLHALVAIRREGSFRLAVDAVSAPKAVKLPRDLRGVDLLFLNPVEAAAILGLAPEGAAPQDLASRLRARGAGAVVLTLGSEGLFLDDGAQAAFLPAVPARLVDATGAGDALIGTTLAGLLMGETLLAAARRGTLAAALTVESDASVRPDLSPALLDASLHRIPRPADPPSLVAPDLRETP